MSELIVTLQKRRKVLLIDAETRAQNAQAEKRSLTAAEQAQIDAVIDEVTQIDERIAELREADARSAASAAARVRFGVTDTGSSGVVHVRSEPTVYNPGNRLERSYFRDLARAQLFGDRDAADNLHRHGQQMLERPEYRALGNTNATGGSGGEFAPPAYLLEEWIPLARPGRVTADLFNRMDVPPGKSSVNLPKIQTGTTVALQTTQNSSLSQTDLTTAYVTTGFGTVGGKQVVSQQLIDQSGIDFDSVIAGDLMGAWGQNIGTNVISGAGTGNSTNSVVNGLINASIPAANQITFTSGSPTAALFYSKAAGALSAFATNRFADPTHWLMHPRRWFWLLAQTDSAGRPLVVPIAAQAYNPMGNQETPGKVAGVVGSFLGLPVVVDPLLPTNVGAGTNQDNVYLIKADDLWFFESPPQMEVFRETYSDSLGVLYRLHSYIGTILNRQAYSLAVISGSGLVAPSF